MRLGLAIFTLCSLLLLPEFLFAQPANNTCATAIALTVNPLGSGCSYSNYTNLNATDSGDGAPSCAFYQGADVWFSAVVPASGHLVIDQSQGTLTNTAMSVYTGSCGSLTEYECDDNSSPNGSMPQIVINDISLAGTAVYVQVWRYNSVNGGTFQICAFEPSVPTNFDCTNATALTVGGTCTYATFTNEYAGDSGDGASTCAFYQGSDVWFSVVVPASGHLVIDQSQGTLLNTAMSVYTGTCGSLTEYECNDNSSPNGNMPQILINDITLAGTTVYVQVWRYNSVNGGTFQICAFEPSVPTNFDCTNATALTVGGTCTYATFTNEYAGDSGDGSPSCAFYQGSDVWFSVVVPASGHLVIDQSQGTLLNTAMSVYTGTCGSLTEYECNDNSSPNGNMPQIVINDITLAGTTIYVQVWRYNSVNGGTFQICAFEPSIPTNFDCTNAAALTVGGTCTYTTFTNEYAGDSGDGSPSCAFYQGSDVWFSVVVPASGHLVIDQSQGTLLNTAMSVYTGTCGSLTEYECNDNSSPNGNMPQIVINDITLAGTTIYVQVWRYNSVNGGTFQICAFEPSIPTNFDCTNAAALTVGGTCTYTTFSNEYAGDSGDGSPSCAFYQGSDVWFSVVVPASGHLVIDQSQGTLLNTAMSVYTGSCGSLTEYECNDNASPNGNMPQIVINDIALAGTTIYVQVWRYNSVNGGTFQICAFEPSIPANVNCANAENLIVTSTANYASYTNEYAGNSGDATPTCAFYAGSDVWFKTKVPSSGDLTLDQIQGTLTNTGMAIYTGACGSLTEYECDDNSSTNGNMPKIEISDLGLSGQDVYIQVWRYNSVNGGTFGITAHSTGVFPVSFSQFKGEINPSNEVALTWQTAWEENTQSFIIERSIDGNIFESIGKIAAAGTSNEARDYAYIDVSPQLGKNIYRLRQIDISGAFDYSKKVEVIYQGPTISWNIYHTPGDYFVKIEQVSISDEPWEVTLLDSQGRIVTQSLNNSRKSEINLTNFPSSIYTLRLREMGNGDGYLVKRLIHIP